MKGLLSLCLAIVLVLTFGDACAWNQFDGVEGWSGLDWVLAEKTPYNIVTGMKYELVDESWFNDITSVNGKSYALVQYYDEGWNGLVCLDTQERLVECKAYSIVGVSGSVIVLGDGSLYDVQTGVYSPCQENAAIYGKIVGDYVIVSWMEDQGVWNWKKQQLEYGDFTFFRNVDRLLFASVKTEGCMEAIVLNTDTGQIERSFEGVWPQRDVIREDGTALLEKADRTYQLVNWRTGEVLLTDMIQGWLPAGKDTWVSPPLALQQGNAEPHRIWFSVPASSMMLEQPMDDVQNMIQRVTGLHPVKLDDGYYVTDKKGDFDNHLYTVYDAEGKRILQTNWIGLDYEYGTGRIMCGRFLDSDGYCYYGREATLSEDGTLGIWVDGHGPAFPVPSSFIFRYPYGFLVSVNTEPRRIRFYDENLQELPIDWIHPYLQEQLDRESEQESF